MSHRRSASSGRGEMVGSLFKASKRLYGSRWRKIFFVCSGTTLAYWKTEDARIKHEKPTRLLQLGADCRVEDTGVDRSSKKELYTITLHYTVASPGSPTGTENRTLVMGSREPEVAATWRQAIQRAREEALHAVEASAPPRAGAGRPRANGSVTPSEPPAVAPVPSAGTSPPGASPRAMTTSGSDSQLANADGADEQATTTLQTASGGGVEAPPLVRQRGGGYGYRRKASIGRIPPQLHAVSDLASTAGWNRAGDSPRSQLVTESGGGGPGSDSGDDAVATTLATGTPWRMVRVENGLRFFEDVESVDDSPCMRSVGRVNAPCDTIFRLVMDFGRWRKEWDCTFADGRIVESQDGHTDVVYHALRQVDTGVFTMAPRDFCLTRNWRRDEDGTYVVVYCSTESAKCPPKPGYVRARLNGGGFLIMPLPGEEDHASLVTHLIDVNPRGWISSPLAKAVGRCMGARFSHTFQCALQYSMLSRVAGIREMFDQLSDYDLSTVGELPVPDADDADEDDDEAVDDGFASPCREASTADGSASKGHSRTSSLGTLSPRMSITESAIDWGGVRKRGTLPFRVWPQARGRESKDNSWCEMDATTFRIRGPGYLENKIKIPAQPAIGDLVAVDWFVDDARMDNLCQRVGGCAEQVLRLAERDDKFVFAVNLQVPAQRQVSMIFYYVLPGEMVRDQGSLLGRMVEADDATRDLHFKLIPAVPKGPWVVQRAVGTKPLIVGGALKVRYFRGPRFLEVDIDIGSSTVANSVVRFVLGYARALVIDMAFLMEAKREEDLPEVVLGTVRVAHLELSSAQPPPPAARANGRRLVLT